MRRAFATFALLTISILSFALVAPSVKKKIITPDKITEVTIHGDMNIIITNDAGGSYYIEGNAGYLDLVNTKISKGKLVVENRSNAKFFKTTIYIPAAVIRELMLNGNCIVTSGEKIITENLLITLNGLSIVNVASAKKGKIKVKAGGDYELENL